MARHRHIVVAAGREHDLVELQGPGLESGGGTSQVKPPGPDELLAVLATQVAWFVALWCAGRLVLSAATRKVVVQGG